MKSILGFLWNLTHTHTHSGEGRFPFIQCFYCIKTDRGILFNTTIFKHFDLLSQMAPKIPYMVGN